MSDSGKWWDVSWNPVTGCTPCSPACEHCYAKRLAETRLRGRYGYPEDEPFRVTVHPERLSQPFHWRKPRTVFVCDMGDLFHEEVPFKFIAAVYGMMQACPQMTFCVLTKRVARCLEWQDWLSYADIYGDPSGWSRESLLCANMAWGESVFQHKYHPDIFRCARQWPPKNVMLGVSVWDQASADKNIPLLLQCPAAGRFVSYEPALASVDFSAIRGVKAPECLDWVIMGGESGPGARRMDVAWAWAARDECAASSVPFWMKQMSSRSPIPDDLRIREKPEMLMEAAK